MLNIQATSVYVRGKRPIKSFGIIGRASFLYFLVVVIVGTIF